MPCTSRNPMPPCEEGYYEKENKKGETCCYKGEKKTKKICTKINPEPPCLEGYQPEDRGKGLCCYKNSKIKKPKKEKNNSNIIYVKTPYGAIKKNILDSKFPKDSDFLNYYYRMSEQNLFNKYFSYTNNIFSNIIRFPIFDFSLAFCFVDLV